MSAYTLEPGSSPLIGILGGTGPLATAQIHQLVVRKALAMGAHNDHDFPSLMVWNVGIKGNDKYGVAQTSHRQIQRAVKMMYEAGCMIVIPACNSMCGISERVADLPQAVIDHAGADKKLGVICSRTCRENRLYKSGHVIYPQQQSEVDDLIELAMLGKNDSMHMDKVIAELRMRGAERIVIGCTELSSHHQPGGWPEDVIDSSDVAAQMVINYSKAATPC